MTYQTIIKRYFIIPVSVVGNTKVFFSKFGTFFDKGHKFKKEPSVDQFFDTTSQFLDVASASNALGSFPDPFGKFTPYWNEIKLFKNAVEHFRWDALSLETIDDIHDTQNTLGYFKKNNSFTDFVWYLMCWIAKGLNVVLQITALCRVISDFKNRKCITSYFASLSVVVTELFDAISSLDSEIVPLAEVYNNCSNSFYNTFQIRPLQWMKETLQKPRQTMQRFFSFCIYIKDLVIYTFTSHEEADILIYFLKNLWKLLVTLINMRALVFFVVAQLLPYLELSPASRFPYFQISFFPAFEKFSPSAQEIFCKPIRNRVSPSLLNALSLCYDYFIASIQLRFIASPTYPDKMVTFFKRPERPLSSNTSITPILSDPPTPYLIPA